MKGSLIVLAAIAATLCISPALWAKTFYLKNGEEIAYKQYWQKEGRVYVLINRDTLVDFAPEEVDLAKTAKDARGAAKKKVKHRKHVKRPAASKGTPCPPAKGKPAPPAPSAPPAPAKAKPAASQAAPAAL